MDKKVYWQEWALMATMLVVGALLVSVVMACLPGCSSAMPGLGEFPCGPKVLIFHADWCHNCPTMEEIIALQDQFPNCEVVEVNIDDYPEIAERYHVTNIPRFFLCDTNGCQTTTSFDELKGWLRAL